MGEYTRGTYVGDAPALRIEEGMVIASSPIGDFIMRPSTLRKYVTRGQALLAKWDCEQMGAVPLRGKKPHA